MSVGGAMQSAVSPVATGQRTRDEAMKYFLQLFQKLERKPGAQWPGLANACTDLWLRGGQRGTQAGL